MYMVWENDLQFHLSIEDDQYFSCHFQLVKMEVQGTTATQGRVLQRYEAVENMSSYRCKSGPKLCVVMSVRGSQIRVFPISSRIAWHVQIQASPCLVQMPGFINCLISIKAMGKPAVGICWDLMSCKDILLQHFVLEVTCYPLYCGFWVSGLTSHFSLFFCFPTFSFFSQSVTP